ncbi:MAG: Fe-S cluster assembly protein SufD, partial [Acidiferrobacterales bacterium]
MNAATESKEAYLDAFAQTASALAGQDVPWIQQTREAAISRFAEQGFPTIRDEDWKYTNVAPIQRSAFHPAAKGSSGLTRERLHEFLFPNLACHRLVFVNGHYMPELSS